MSRLVRLSEGDSPARYACRLCGRHDRAVLAWVVFANGVAHVHARCASCGAHLAWVRQEPAVLAAVGPTPVVVRTESEVQGLLW